MSKLSFLFSKVIFLVGKTNCVGLMDSYDMNGIALSFDLAYIQGNPWNRRVGQNIRQIFFQLSTSKLTDPSKRTIRRNCGFHLRTILRPDNARRQPRSLHKYERRTTFPILRRHLKCPKSNNNGPRYLNVNLPSSIIRYPMSPTSPSKSCPPPPIRLESNWSIRPHARTLRRPNSLQRR
jgi:hypothetical protein